MSKIDQIKELIAEGNTEEAIEILVEYTKKQKPELHDEAVLLSGQFRQWKRQQTLGVQQSSSELHRIDLAIMNVLDDKSGSFTETGASTITKSKSIPVKQKKTNYLPFVAIAVGLLLGGMAIWIYDHSGPDSASNANAGSTSQEATTASTGNSDKLVPKTNKLVPPTEKHFFTWSEKNAGNGVAGGSENGQNLIICRCEYEGSYHSGKVVGGKCNIGYAGDEQAIENFEVLTGQNNISPKWISVTNNQIPQGAFPAGIEKDTIYVCRVQRPDGSVHPGKIIPNESGTGYNCNYGYAGNEVIEEERFEVLIGALK